MFWLIIFTLMINMYQFIFPFETFSPKLDADYIVI